MASKRPVARAHVRHIHAQNPEELVALAVAQFAQRFEEALHLSSSSGSPPW